MEAFRITKYDPTYRDAQGRYTKNEWTQYQGVGKSFDGVVFTEREYMQTKKEKAICTGYVQMAFD